MAIEDVIQDPSAKWSRQKAASAESLVALRDGCAYQLPSDYIAFLGVSDGGDGELSVKPGWFQIWQSDEVIELNRGYEVSQSIPGFFGFGSNGGGELLAFDTRHGEPWKIVMIPFIPMDEKEAIEIAPDFLSFVKLLGKPMPENNQSS